MVSVTVEAQNARGAGHKALMCTCRFRKPRSGAGTAAAANAVCQRCLQKGHFTFQCKNQAVYHVRPSRTQQLLNPKVRQNAPTSSSSALVSAHCQVARPASGRLLMRSGCSTATVLWDLDDDGAKHSSGLLTLA